MKTYEIIITKKVPAFSQEHAEMQAAKIAKADDNTIIEVKEDYIPF